MERDEAYLRHIRDAIAAVEEYVAGASKDDFLKKRLVQDGVIRQLQIIGEASKRLTETTRARSAETPWKAIIGMREKLVHDYFGIDLDEVWEVVEHDLGKLKRTVAKLIT